MMEPQLGFGSSYTGAGYFAALFVLTSIAVASKSLAPAVASTCPYMIICNTYASIICSNSISARILAGSNLYATVSAAFFTNYACIINTVTSVLNTRRNPVVNQKCYEKKSTDTIKRLALHLAPL